MIKLTHEDVRCVLCEAKKHRLLYTYTGGTVYVDDAPKHVSGTEKVVRCPGCGLIYVAPRPLFPPGVEVYPLAVRKDYFTSTVRQRRRKYNLLLLEIEQVLGRKGRLLDVGFGDGVLLHEAVQLGWEIHGVEPDGDLFDLARQKYHLTSILNDTLEFTGYPDDFFDVVLLINVLEHVRTPLSVMREVTRILSPKGLAAIHVPNVGGVPARLLRSRWHHYVPLEHFYYFDIHTLRRLLQKAGLTVSHEFALIESQNGLRRLLGFAQGLGIRLGNGLGVLASPVPR